MNKTLQRPFLTVKHDFTVQTLLKTSQQNLNHIFAENSTFLNRFSGDDFVRLYDTLRNQPNQSPVHKLLTKLLHHIQNKRRLPRPISVQIPRIEIKPRITDRLPNFRKQDRLITKIQHRIERITRATCLPPLKSQLRRQNLPNTTPIIPGSFSLQIHNLLTLL